MPRRYISQAARRLQRYPTPHSTLLTQWLSTTRPFSSSVVQGTSDISPPSGCSVSPHSPSLQYGQLNLLMTSGHGATVVFLLRNPKVFDDDASVKPYLDSGKAILVKGDALSADDVANAWKKAAEVTGRVDFVIFSVGMSSSQSSICPMSHTVLFQVQLPRSHWPTEPSSTPKTYVPSLVSTFYATCLNSSRNQSSSSSVRQVSPRLPTKTSPSFSNPSTPGSYRCPMPTSLA